MKRWARMTMSLASCQSAVMTELANEPAARQQAQTMFGESLGSSEERRRIALQLAIASFQVP
ncbi:MAG: hypothetical protein KGJ23_09480 [Euryarchaeota archaeon]|nr:hypothetical protein [Euryarchaeota archaeon]MDE1836833.1 hypothetical protein [Euryarchaeota archaeon]MDE1882042.1 hypothetical protein [Euryarchaeota archaeon]